MRFRTHLILAVFVVVSLIVGGLWLSTVRVLENSAQIRLRHEVDRDLGAVAELLNTRRSILEGEVRVVAAEPRLKAITAAQEVTHETVFGVAAELKEALGSDVFLLTDAEGTLLVDVADPDAQGFDMSGDPVIAGALAEGSATGIWTFEDHVYLMQSQRLAFGARTAGILAVGYDVSDAFLKAAHRQTGADIALLLDGRVVGRATGAHELSPVALNDVVERLPTAGQTTVRIGGERFIVGVHALPGYEGERSVRFTILRSLEEAMEPARKLTRIIEWLTVAGLVIGLLLALVFAQRLSSPLSKLVEFSKAIGRGELAPTEVVSGPQEIQVLSNSMNAMARDLAANQAQLVATERLEREMEIARSVQLSILPTTLEVPGLRLAAKMTTASEVGGDYYDVIPHDGGAWIGIGDVAGHGLPAGLVMVMVQSCVSTLVRESVDASPASLVEKVNTVIYDNVHLRLGQKEYVTFSLFRYDGGGKFTVAGAHEDFIIHRARTNQCERIVVEGTWVGVIEDIHGLLENVTFTLEPGDLLILYTDGIIEARDDGREAFDMDGLEREIIAAAQDDVELICSKIFAAVGNWRDEQLDDETVVVIRYLGDESQG